MAEDRIADYLNQPGNRAAFHVGDFPQMLPATDGEPTEADVAAVEADRARLKVPYSKPRWGVDDDGNPIEAPASGLVFNPETGGLEVVEPEAAPEPAPKATTASTRSASSGQAATSTTSSGSTSSSS